MRGTSWVHHTTGGGGGALSLGQSIGTVTRDGVKQSSPILERKVKQALVFILSKCIIMVFRGLLYVQ